MPAKEPRRFGWLWATALTFISAYLAMWLAGKTALADKAPVLATAAAVGVTIVAARRARSVVRGALTGLGLGLTGAMGIAAALAEPGKPIHPEQLATAAAVAALTTMICCTVAGAVFAVLAERRRE